MDPQKTKLESSTLQLNSKGDEEVTPTASDAVKLSCGDRVTKLRQYITVEPFLTCYILSSVIAALAVLNLNLEKACRVNLKYSNETCNNIMSGNAANLTEEVAQVQTLVANMAAWTTPLQTGIPALMILFVGAWSDRTGNRKACLLMPMIGEIVSSIGLLFCTYYYLEWSLEAAGLIQALPPALTGGVSTIIMAVFSYMADITSIEDRTFRIGIVTIIVTLGIPIGTSVSGIIIKELGLYAVFCITLFFYVFGFVYGYFRLDNKLKDSRTVSKKEQCVEFFSPKHVLETVVVAFKARSGTRRLRIILVIFAYIVIVGPLYGEAQVTYLFTRYKYNFTEADFSLYSTYSVLFGLVGKTVVITLFSKYMQMDDSMIGVIAAISRIAASFVFAFAPTPGWYYLGPVFDTFRYTAITGHTAVTAIRSLATKLVEEDEVGKLGSLLGVSDALVPVIYSPAYSRVYVATLATLPGAFYLLGGALTVPALFVFIILYVLQKREKDTVADPSTKEAYARDNEVTSL